MSNNQTKNQAATGMSIADNPEFNKNMAGLPLIQYRAVVALVDAQLARQGQGFAKLDLTDYSKAVNYSNGTSTVITALASARPADPMDWPLPCDVTVGSGTMKKGTALRLLVKRMETLHGMAMDGLKSSSAQPDRGVAPEAAKPSDMGQDYAGPDCPHETCDLKDGACACTRAAAPHSQPVRGVPDDLLGARRAVFAAFGECVTQDMTPTEIADRLLAAAPVSPQGAQVRGEGV